MPYGLYFVWYEITVTAPRWHWAQRLNY